MDSAGVRSPLLADLQERLLDPDPGRAEPPGAVVDPSPIGIEDHRLRMLSAPHRDARRDLLVGDIADHDGGRGPEVSGQRVLDLIGPAIADADRAWINGLRLAVIGQKKE